MPNFTTYILVTVFVLVCTAALAARTVYIVLAEKLRPKQKADSDCVTITLNTMDKEKESACNINVSAFDAEGLSRKDAEAKLPYAVVVMRHGGAPIELHQISRTCQYNSDAMKAYNSVLEVIEKFHLQLVREHTWIKTPRSDPAEFQVTWFPPL